MKKAIAILLVLLVAGVAFGADTTANLVIGTVITPVESIKISTVELTTGTYTAEPGNEILSFTSANEVTVPTDKTAYINLRTNKKNDYVVSLSGLALMSSNVTTAIGYSLTPVAGEGYSVGAALSVPKTATSTATTVSSFITYTGNSGAGLRVIPAAFTIALTDADWLAATADDDYTTTVTVTVAAQ